MVVDVWGFAVDGAGFVAVAGYLVGEDGKAGVDDAEGFFGGLEGLNCAVGGVWAVVGGWVEEVAEM